MKIYKGKRLGKAEDLPGVRVTVNDKPLRHRVYHSPTGFEWGYGGSGPADLARSILWDFLGYRPARDVYMSFKDKFVSGWHDEWEITSDDIKDWMVGGY